MAWIMLFLGELPEVEVPLGSNLFFSEGSVAPLMEEQDAQFSDRSFSCIQSEFDIFNTLVGFRSPSLRFARDEGMDFFGLPQWT